MKLSGLTELATSRDVVEMFGGYNHNLRIANSDFYDMQNLASVDNAIGQTMLLKYFYNNNLLLSLFM